MLSQVTLGDCVMLYQYHVFYMNFNVSIFGCSLLKPKKRKIKQYNIESINQPHLQQTWSLQEPQNLLPKNLTKTNDEETSSFAHLLGRIKITPGSQKPGTSGGILAIPHFKATFFPQVFQGLKTPGFFKGNLVVSQIPL